MVPSRCALLLACRPYMVCVLLDISKSEVQLCIPRMMYCCTKVFICVQPVATWPLGTLKNWLNRVGVSLRPLGGQDLKNCAVVSCPTVSNNGLWPPRPLPLCFFHYSDIVIVTLVTPPLGVDPSSVLSKHTQGDERRLRRACMQPVG